jgi:two-component system catabolic regulation response regulator CreB
MPAVLLIDDEPAITESLAYALERAGYETRSVATLAGADAALADRAAPFDLIVLDIVLPDGNGLDWLRSLRGRSALPVIILSSHDDAVDRVAGLEVGADDYVDKPFSPREIVARVRAVLRRAVASSGAPDTAPGRAPAPSPANAHFTPRVKIDADRRQAWAAGQRLALSRTEFDLLATLVAAPGRVYTRDQLLDRVWGQGVVVSERTVDAHVKAVRRKLADAGLPADTIETVRGIGYRLAEEPR